MKDLGKTYEPHVFDGAGLRAQGGADGANLKAWPLTIAFLRRHLHFAQHVRDVKPEDLKPPA